MSLPLDLRFTNPTAPLFIDVEADDIETLFVISTTQVSGSQTRGGKSNSQEPQAAQSRKRPREPSSDGATPAPMSVPGSTRPKRPMKAVHRIDLPTPSRTTPNRTSMGPPSSMPMGPPSSISNRVQEPLFLPSLSQLSVQEQQSMEEAGLAGITSMEDLDQLFDDEGLDEEINGFGGASQVIHVADGEDMVFAPTQEPSVERTFKPLFHD